MSDIFFRSVMLRSHCPTPKQTEINHRSRFESVLVSVSVQYENFLLFIGFGANSVNTP